MNLKQPMTLPDIDRLAAAELNGKSYWGHLDLPIESYEYLRESLSERCKYKPLKTILSHYPVATYSVSLRDAENENDTDLISFNPDDIPGVEDFVCFNDRGACAKNDPVTSGIFYFKARGRNLRLFVFKSIIKGNKFLGFNR